MGYIDSLIKNRWVTSSMDNKREVAKDLKSFRPKKYKDKLVSAKGKNKNKLYEKIHKLSVFTNNLDKKSLDKKYKKKVEEFEDFMSHINKSKHKNSFEDYQINVRRPENLPLDMVTTDHVNRFTAKFKLKQKLKDLEFIFNELDIGLEYAGGHNDPKKYEKEKDMIHRDHQKLKRLMYEIKEDEDFQNHELEELVSKENYIDDKVSETLSILEQEKDKLKKGKILRYIARFIGGVALLASLLEVGKYYTENKEDILGSYVRPEHKVEQVKEDVICYYPSQ